MMKALRGWGGAIAAAACVFLLAAVALFLVPRDPEPQERPVSLEPAPQEPVEPVEQEPAVQEPVAQEPAPEEPAPGGLAEVGGPRFGVPIACTPDLDCAVQNYVDQDPGPAATDFTCGFLTYDGHKGVDIRLPDMSWLDRKVPVLAAADGTVLRVRDSMPDISIRDPDAVALEGRDAGNSVIIDHGGGWETQYGHMHKDSVIVAPGDVVKAGDPIGAVGLSGNTEFPHVHFEVRHQGKTVDPYTGPLETPACGQTPDPLWTAEAATALAYRPTGMLAMGFVGTAPDADAIRDGAYDGATVLKDAPALVFWVSLYGIRKGDRQTISLHGPDGTALAESTEELPGPKASWIAWTGRKLRAEGWPAGTYRGVYRLVRASESGETVVVEEQRTIDMR